MPYLSRFWPLMGKPPTQRGWGQGHKTTKRVGARATARDGDQLYCTALLHCAADAALQDLHCTAGPALHCIALHCPDLQKAVLNHQSVSWAGTLINITQTFWVIHSNNLGLENILLRFIQAD